MSGHLDPGEEMQRLLRRLEEMDEAQHLQLPQSSPSPSLEGLAVVEAAQRGSRSDQQRQTEAPSHCERGGGKRPGKSRERRLGRKTTIAGTAAVVAATIVIGKMFTTPFALASFSKLHDGIADAQIVTSAGRALLHVQPKVRPTVLTVSTEIVAEPEKHPSPHLSVPSAKTVLQSDQVWPIGVQITTGNVEGMLATISGLTDGAALTLGRSLSATSWELDAADLNSAIVIPPVGFVGSMDVRIVLRREGAVVDEQDIRGEWLGKTTVEVPQVSAAAMAPGEISRLFGRGEVLLANGEVAAARAMFKHLADLGEQRAAFALAETYEQATLDRLGARGIVADTETAKTWYKRAKELGSAKAQDPSNPRISHSSYGLASPPTDSNY